MTEQTVSRTLLAWQSLQTYDHHRGRLWYQIGAVFLVGFIGYGIIDKSISTVIVGLLIGGVYYLMKNQKPEKENVRITGFGIHVGANFLQWNMIRDFWILNPEEGGLRIPELHISPLKNFRPEVVIFLNDVDPADIRRILLLYIPERAGMEERFLDTLARMLKL